MEDGLSQTKVSQIVQDDQGFIWFGSQYGLNRYDGYKFKVFKHEPGRTNSLSGVLISSLFKDGSFLDDYKGLIGVIGFSHKEKSAADARGRILPFFARHLI